jgi:glycosyltransferase involved in cell wall biosynthesis
MRILVVCPYFYPAISFGGVTQTSYNLSCELAKLNHEVIVYTSDAMSMTSRLRVPKVVSIDGITIHYFRCLSSHNMAGFFVTPELISAANNSLNEFDIVHLHEYRTFQNVVVSSFAKRVQTPYVIQPHGTLPRIEQYFIRKQAFDTIFGNNILKHASAGIPMSQFESNHFNRINSWNGPLEVIPNTISLKKFNSLINAAQFRLKYDIDEESKIILFLGRLNRIKNIDVLIKSFDSVLKHSMNAVLVIAGPNDGELKTLRNLTMDLGISDKVVFTGMLYFKEKLLALKTCDILVLPSKYELFGTVILEAFACCKPVIASNVGSSPDLVIPGTTGFLFEPGNVQQLSSCILRMLRNPDESSKMGLAGRELVEGRYSLDQVVLELESLFRSIIE